ncbi:PRD domain-containing protein [Liquorilactobacillus hordei]|uniref:Transcriptional regulator n=1 Tax=Liquorilactobacillus hordei DSM 19519 TaxID=1423759 RepID=A0A0R1MB48_9LACO|nr:PRD domain-containing protein [Liquorilactobacillus hordei]KRL05308.1 transcriptional regulator [Liquorilactobacillus hordei DSM 19519]QYH51223.1 PRD domain-containing protein [Liquorilactobacillus hordei DSM 19519]QYH53053.1 PRD domain-containing protein [Liquorilactobacillus hordei DSM 19519]
MNAIEKLYAAIAQQFPDERITTKQAADTVGLTRGVTSSYLSKLEKQGKLLKTGSRPVYWQIKRDESAFDELIGFRGSLREDINHAIEAIVYPGHGLPILIIGAHGTGKLSLAQGIFKEAIQRGIFTQEAVFKIIDCGKYKNKFNLLQREVQSIGKKEQAGFLYIKNLQVLHSEKQHELFMLANQQEKTNIRFIFSAITDLNNTNYIDFNCALVQIRLSLLNERPLDERITFVGLFLQRQANKIGKDIVISPRLLIKLAKFTNVGSISELNNRIQLLCAEAYAKAPNIKQLVISKADENAICITPNRELLETRITSLVTSALQLGPTATNLLKELSESLLAGETITEQNFLVLKVLNQVDTTVSESLLTALSQTIRQSSQEAITHQYGVTFQDDDNFWRYVALAFVFASLCGDNLPITESVPKLQVEIKKRYPRSHYLFKQLLNKIAPQNIKSAYYYLPFFVLMVQCSEKIESVHYNAILLTHGEHTASSIQQVVNTLCGNYFFEAFDMPIDVSINRINAYVRDYLVDQGSSPKGNIILFDMGSLREMFREIKKVSDQELLVVNNVTTSMALDIGLRIQRNELFQSIADASQKYSSTTDTQYYEGLSNRKNIIVSCMSGVGLSEELKKLIEETLSLSLEVIAIDYKHLHALLKNNDRQFFSNTQLILTTTDVSGDMGIDIINIYNIFDKSVSLKLETILLQTGETQKSSNLLIERLLRFLSIEGIRGRLQILNPDVVIQESQDIVSHYENFYNVKFEPRLKLNLYMHLSLMIERMLVSTTVSENSFQEASLTPRKKDFISLSKGIFQPVEQKFNIKVQNYEIELLYQLLKDFIFIDK